jgi:hypothetical protein
MDQADLVRRVQEYADRRRLVVGKSLGSGVHGSVFAAESQTQGGQSALKVHERESAYCRERDAYLRLRERDITTIRGCNVPELIDFDDDLWVIEMTVVTRPFVLDFGGAYLDAPPDFSEEVLADWRAEKEEQFGSRWPEVQAILRALEGHGVFVVDVNPGNVAFVDPS